jgi:hypothetical protein
MSETAHLDLGEEYKEKLKDIAEKQQRSMTSQVRYWIDQYKGEKQR